MDTTDLTIVILATMINFLPAIVALYRRHPARLAIFIGCLVAATAFLIAADDYPRFAALIGLVWVALLIKSFTSTTTASQPAAPAVTTYHI